MSAFIVSDTHISAIVKWASRNNVDTVRGNEQATADMLLAENTRSVNARYKEESPVAVIVCDPRAPELSLVQVIKACHCLDYQSCETDNWETTPAYQLLQAIESKAVRQLPGYAYAPWSIT